MALRHGNWKIHFAVQRAEGIGCMANCWCLRLHHHADQPADRPCERPETSRSLPTASGVPGSRVFALAPARSNRRDVYNGLP